MIFSPTPNNIAQAAQIIAAGGIIGLPTETVYGLAADASNADAVGLVYTTKGRPSDHPLIVHLAPQAGTLHWAATAPSFARDLIKSFWPGPLTVVLPRTAHAGDFITGRQKTVALRCPAHPVAQALLQACLEAGIHGLAAPSANRFGRMSPTTAQHVVDEFDTPVFTLDGGACEVGIESTIVDCTGAMPRILRHGAITLDDVARVTGLVVLDAVGHNNSPRVSGSLAAHYAPATPLLLCAAQDSGKLASTAVYVGFDKPVQLPMSCAFHAMPSDATLYARQLYATLRNLDTMGYSQIAVQPVPPSIAWAGVRDRLGRAAATFA